MSDPPPSRSKDEARRDRLAQALRENLKRRKAQQRGRADEGSGTEGDSEFPPAAEIG